jgi:adenine-specific DNA-methyltransferase
MPPKKKTAAITPVESVKHKDKRRNIPTEELRDFRRRRESAQHRFLPARPVARPATGVEGQG